jgi:hypothetical protein
MYTCTDAKTNTCGKGHSGFNSTAAAAFRSDFAPTSVGACAHGKERRICLLRKGHARWREKHELHISSPQVRLERLKDSIPAATHALGKGKSVG